MFKESTVFLKRFRSTVSTKGVPFSVYFIITVVGNVWKSSKLDVAQHCLLHCVPPLAVAMAGPHTHKQVNDIWTSVAKDRPHRVIGNEDIFDAMRSHITEIKSHVGWS